MALDTTLGGVDANSYVTLAEADSYFGDRLGSSAYTDLSDADQEKVLRQATREVDRQRFYGAPHYWSQRLQFPRQYPYNSERPESGTALEIPRSVKEATFEQALWIAQHAATGGRSSRQQLQGEGVTQFRVGSAAETFEGARLSPLCPEARQLLSRWTTRWGQASDGRAGDGGPQGNWR